MAQDTGRAAVTDPTSSIETESTDRLFRALADDSRRAAVAYLTDCERAVSREELVDQIAFETGERVDDGSQRERLATLFHHHHLPTLDAAGLVDYDPERAVVRGTDLADRVDRWMGWL